MLQRVEITELKAGRPFHRLAQLRDAGRTQLAMLEAPDVADAEWMVESTPAHAISLPFDLSDQLAKYRVLPAAREMGTAILSRRAAPARWPLDPPASAAENIAFRAGEEDVAAVIEPLAEDVKTLELLLAAVRSPMPPAEREQWWTRFQAHVPPPAKRPRGHPPEYGT
jgi:hypothetical protein